MPVLRMFATLGLDAFHANPARLLLTLPSLNVPDAVNLISVCAAILGFAGLIVMLTR